MIDREKTLYEAIGGDKVIHSLVTTFYNKVSKDPILSPIFPSDLTETARKQHQFLTQYLGGPPLYTEEHGHPMLRARHIPFEVTPSRAKRWLELMSQAIEETEITGQAKEVFFQKLILTAQHMINTPDDPDQKGESL